MNLCIIQIDGRGRPSRLYTKRSSFDDLKQYIADIARRNGVLESDIKKEILNADEMDEFPIGIHFQHGGRTDTNPSGVWIMNIEDMAEMPAPKQKNNYLNIFQDHIDWMHLSFVAKLPEDFIREFQDKVDWDYISSNQVLSEPFIREFQDKVNWHHVFRYQELSNEFRKEFGHKQ